MDRIWLPQDVVELIASEASRHRVRETGGPLFGYDVDDGVVVTQVRGPGPHAEHRRTRLVPDVEATQQATDEIHKATDGREWYLGDWHTHPLGGTTPSQVDIGSAAKQASDPDLHLTTPVVVIQSTKLLRKKAVPAELRAFRWSMTGHFLEQLHLVVTDSP